MISVMLSGMLSLFAAVGGDAQERAGQSVQAPVAQQAGPSALQDPGSLPGRAVDYAQREAASRDLEEFRGGGVGLLVLIIVVVAVLVLVAIIIPW